MLFKRFVLVAAVLAFSLGTAAHPVIDNEPLNDRNIENAQIRYARPVPGQRRVGNGKKG